MAEPSKVFAVAVGEPSAKDGGIFGAIMRLVGLGKIEQANPSYDDEAAYGHIAHQISKSTNTLPQIVLGLWDSFREKQGMPYWMSIERVETSYDGPFGRMMEDFAAHVSEEKRKLSFDELKVMIRQNHKVWDGTSQAYVRRDPLAPAVS